MFRRLRQAQEELERAEAEERSRLVRSTKMSQYWMLTNILLTLNFDVSITWSYLDMNKEETNSNLINREKLSQLIGYHVTFIYNFVPILYDLEYSKLRGKWQYRKRRRA